jgi:hypothetical protein
MGRRRTVVDEKNKSESEEVNEEQETRGESWKREGNEMREQEHLQPPAPPQTTTATGRSI